MEHTFKTFGTMLDCSRNAVMTAESVRRWIDLTAKLGCNTLHLYMEDTYEVDGQPYFGHLRGRYSKAELKQIDAYAAAHGCRSSRASRRLPMSTPCFTGRSTGRSATPPISC